MLFKKLILCKRGKTINSHIITLTTLSFFFSTKQKFTCHNTYLFFTENILFSIRFHPPATPPKRNSTYIKQRNKEELWLFGYSNGASSSYCNRVKKTEGKLSQLAHFLYLGIHSPVSHFHHMKSISEHQMVASRSLYKVT